MSDKPRASEPHDGPDQGQPPDPSPGVPVPASTSSEQAEADPAAPWWDPGGGRQISADPADRPVAAEPGVMDSREPPGPGTGPPLDPSVLPDLPGPDWSPQGTTALRVSSGGQSWSGSSSSSGRPFSAYSRCPVPLRPRRQGLPTCLWRAMPDSGRRSLPNRNGVSSPLAPPPIK
jgi:hypothetical protein